MPRKVWSKGNFQEIYYGKYDHSSPTFKPPLHFPLFFSPTKSSVHFLSPQLSSSFSLSSTSSTTMMKLVKINTKTHKFTPKRFFRRKKTAGDELSPSNSDPPSFGTGTTSSSSSSTSDLKAGLGSATPQSVLPELSDFSAELSEAFRHMDHDNDGVVSRKELEALLSQLGGGDTEADFVAMMLSEVGVDDDGVISVDALMSRLADSAGANEPAEDSELRHVFKIFDSNRDGKISAEELLSFYATIGGERCTIEDCRRMIAGVDGNGDGFVCFEDFSRMMKLQRL